MRDYAQALGFRLRQIRVQQGLSLHGVEAKSQGRWKAVVIGSYERGDRALTAQRLSELAAFYRVPIIELLPQPRGAEAPKGEVGLVIALEQIARVPDEQCEPLARYTRRIQTERGDYNGRVLSLRADDLRSLAVLYDASREEVEERLAEWGVLVPQARQGFRCRLRVASRAATECTMAGPGAGAGARSMRFSSRHLKLQPDASVGGAPSLRAQPP